MNAADVISALSILIAMLTLIVNINKWRKEFVGKRRIDLAENVLAIFYEAQDAIREIRNPFSFSGEGSSRKRGDHEDEWETRVLDNAYVVYERYQKREKLFSELRSMKYRYMATFGKDSGEPFDELNKILQEIFFAANMLGTHYWKRQARGDMTEEEIRAHRKEMEEYESVFWSYTTREDKIAPRVKTVIEKIEAILRKETQD